MPKGKKGKQQEEEEIVAEEKLQAVVIAQAFELEKSWAPLSCDVPPALFPLANVPLIDYTMELLVSAGVQEMFVFCGGGEHGRQIKAYLRTSQWCA
jgi:translation initiation factor eIF-2B subunit epsilon